MGEVYQARDTRLGRDVAIKILPADVAADPDRLARFEREGKAVSALNHPNIVTLYEVGTSESGPYLVLERVEGQSLRSLIEAGSLPLRKLVDLGAQIAAGLAKAHAAGVVHRDLKPDNVMVTGDGFAKILDFGLARLVWPDEGVGDAADTATFVKETSSGVILGTLGYLSPEQEAAIGAVLEQWSHQDRVVLASLPAMTLVRQAVLLASIGDIACFRDDRQLRKLLGWYPEARESGSSLSKHRLGRSGNRMARHEVWLWAWELIAPAHANTPFRDYYSRLRARGMVGRVAMGHLAGKLISVLFHCLRSGIPYDPQRHARDLGIVDT